MLTSDAAAAADTLLVSSTETATSATVMPESWGLDDSDYLASKEALFRPASAVVEPPVVADPVTPPAEEPEIAATEGDPAPQALEVPAAPAVADPAPVADDDPTDVLSFAQRLSAIAAKQGSPIDSDTAIARAKVALGLDQPAAVTAEPAQALPDLAAIEARLAEIDAKRAKARADFDPDALDALMDEQRKLLAEHAEAQTAHRFAEFEANEKQQASFNQAWDASFAEVSEIYPDFADDKSPAFKAMAEMQAKLEKLGDPEVFKATGPKYIGVMTAKALGLVPGLSVKLDQSPATSAVKPASSARPVAANVAPPARGPQPHSGAGSPAPATTLSVLLDQAAYDDAAYLAVQRGLTGGRR